MILGVEDGWGLEGLTKIAIVDLVLYFVEVFSIHVVIVDTLLELFP